MHKILFAFLIISVAVGCKNKHASLSGKEPVDIKDFIEAFPKITLPYRITDTNMTRLTDTTTISYAIFSEFIPGTVLANAFGKNVQSVNITSEPAFIISREKINQQNELVYTRNGYAYNDDSKTFIPVMNDSNEDLKRLNEIINPIDTFAAKNKLSADYTKDKQNFISVRDGTHPNKYLFFIHFDKDGCKGELKGEMTMRDATHAYYQESGDPCVIDFTFFGKSITVKERGNCGNHRGIKCFFDDTYRKKKESKTSASSKNK